jgi:cell wall-associated NlpC family hydrolase|tara:strand:- start:101 stop:1045 length:945 start_codon:yes stop_codon:yes gene_type:complete
MVLKKQLLLYVLIVISNLMFAENDLNKVEALFNAGKYEKSYKKSEKLKGESAYYKKAKTYYLLGFSLLNIQNDQAKKLGVFNREKSIISYVIKGVKYQKSNSELKRFKQFFQGFTQLAKKRLLQSKKLRKEREWKGIAELLAQQFNDTTPAYWEAHKVIEEAEVKEKVLAAKENEVFVKELLRNNKRDSIIRWARTYIGTPYVFAGVSRKGIDCSGFTSTVLNHFGSNLPHSCKTQATLGKKTKQYKAGDLALFGYKSSNGTVKPSHVGIVISNYPEPLKVIHATSSLGVRIDDIKASSYWKPKFLFTVNVLGK